MQVLYPSHGVKADFVGQHRPFVESILLVWGLISLYLEESFKEASWYWKGYLVFLCFAITKISISNVKFAVFNHTVKIALKQCCGFTK
jgi:hypothetical protein